MLNLNNFIFYTSFWDFLLAKPNPASALVNLVLHAPRPLRLVHSGRDTQREAARTDASVGGATAGIIHYKGFALPRGTSAHSGAAVARPGHATLAPAAPRRAAHFPFRDGSHA